MYAPLLAILRSEIPNYQMDPTSSSLGKLRAMATANEHVKQAKKTRLSSSMSAI